MRKIKNVFSREKPAKAKKFEIKYLSAVKYESKKRRQETKQKEGKDFGDKEIRLFI